MTKNANGISLKKSCLKTDGKPNLPSPDKLVFGELAVNYAGGVETISTKNESGDVVTFSSDDYFKNQYLAWEKGEDVGSAKIVANSGITSGAFAISEGRATSAITEGPNGGAHAEGLATIASGNCTHAEGCSTSAMTQGMPGGAHAEGVSTLASGQGAHAEGSSTSAITDYPGAHAEGSNCVASGQGTHAEGYSSSAMTNSMPTAHAEGFRTLASAGAAHAEGNVTRATGQFSHAEGNMAQSTGQQAHAEGQSTIASGSSSHAEGNYTKANGDSSHAEGESTLADGSYSHAEGRYSKTSGDSAHAEGESTLASGSYGSHAEGYGTTASGQYGSHAEGYGTTASGEASHAEGYSSSALTAYAHAEGNYTLASGSYAHTEGSYTKASGQCAHAEGSSTNAYGPVSHAEGQYTSALTACAHAEGNYTLANGEGAHAEGNFTSALTKYSHAEGNYTKTTNLYEHASGSYNISSSASTTFGHSGNTLFSVGNGSNTTPHNAFEIRQNGDIYIINKDGNDVRLQDEIGNIDVDQVLDETTSASTNPVATQAVYNVYHEFETVVSAAINDLNTNKFGYAEYDPTNKKIYFYKNSTETSIPLCEINATDFIKDGMVDNVEVKDVTSGGSQVTCLVITFNTDSGKEDINIPISDIFDASNYYTKSETSGKTELSTEFALYVKKADVDQTIDSTTSASTNPVSTSGVYDFVTSYTPSITVDQVLDDTTSASTNPVATKAVYDVIVDNEMVWANAFAVLSGVVSSHTENTDIHVTSTDKDNLATLADNIETITNITPTKISNWDAAAANSHSHSNKSALDSITGNVGTMAYENKTSYSSATEVNTALGNKAAQSDLNTLSGTVTGHTANTGIHLTSTQKENIDSLETNIDAISGITSTDITNWDNAATNSHTHSNTAALNSITGNVGTMAYENTSSYSSATEVNTALGNKLGTSEFNTYSGAVDTAIGSKAAQSDLNSLSGTVTSHTADNSIHLSSTEKTNLDSLGANIAAISGITSTKVGNWDTAATNTHSHSNTAALNSITGNVGTMAYEDKDSYSSATQVNTALSGKSNTGHTHDDRYYTESELTGNSTTVVVAKAASATTAATAAVANSVALSNVSGADDIKAIEALTGTSGLLKKTAANTWALDTTSYSSATQVNTALSGKSNTGHTHDASGVTAMTGYQIASSSASVLSTDSLLQTIGKLEKRIAILEAALGGMTLVKLTSAQYEALTTKDPNTMYIIND